MKKNFDNFLFDYDYNKYITQTEYVSYYTRLKADYKKNAHRVGFSLVVIIIIIVYLSIIYYSIIIFYYNLAVVLDIDYL